AHAREQQAFGPVRRRSPRRLVVLLRALASLWDETGDVAVDGLRREEWTGESYTDEEFRALAQVEQGMPIVGTGGIRHGPVLAARDDDGLGGRDARVLRVADPLAARARLRPYGRGGDDHRLDHGRRDGVDGQPVLDRR